MKTIIVGTAAFVLTAAGLTACTLDVGDIQTQMDDAITEVVGPLSIVDIAEQVGPAVVQLNVYDETGAGGTGSGFVISEDGFIVTNHHVAATLGEDAFIDVIFADESVAAGELVGSDEGYDIAVVKVDADGLDTLPFKRPLPEVVVGELAVALGSPLGLSNTVTAGIVSALNRPVTAGGDGSISFINAIQTDAAINPGNSGGPLVNGYGELIGVNTAIASLGVGGAAGSIGLGFAIPVETVQRVVNEIIDTGSSTTPVIGVSLDTEFFGPGARIAEVTPGGTGEEAGLKAGDIIVAVDGNLIAESTELIVSIRANAPGDVVELLVFSDGSNKTIEVTLGTQ